MNAAQDLREFIAQLEACGELKRIAVEIDPKLEMTERSEERRVGEEC